MKIWLNRSLLAYDLGDKLDHASCRPDDPPDPCFVDESSHPVVSPLVFNARMPQIFKHTFVLAKELHIQEIRDGYWLLCNPLKSGNVAVLDREAYKTLLSFYTPKKLRESNEDIYVTFSSQARVVALLAYLGFLQDLDQPEPAPDGKQQMLAAWLHITNACNLRCHYCYVHKTSEHMADDTSKRAVDAIFRSAERHHYGGVHLTYAGGEATLRLPQVMAIHDYAFEQALARGLYLSASLLSNGVFLPRKALEQIKQRQIRVGISLDGIGEYHDQQRPFLNGRGSFKLVDRTISQMLDAGCIPSINVTVTQRNLDELPRLLGYLLQHELPFGLSYYRENACSAQMSNLQFTDAQMINGMLTAFSYIEQHLPRKPLLGALVNKATMGAPRQYACGVGRHYLAIDQRGGIARCQAEITDTVTTIDAEDPLQAIRQHAQGVQAVPVEEKEGCCTCEWRHWCTGGCPMLTYRLTGRSDIKSPNCAIYKALFPEALRLEGLRLLAYEDPVPFEELVHF